MEREYVNESPRNHDDESSVAPVVPQTKVPSIDNLLADIDAVLEQNSQEFVNNFIQKGGQ